MSLKITIMSSEQTKEPEAIKTFKTFDDMANAFSICQEGEKSGYGFVRGPIRKNGKRCDEDLEYSEILILDVDAGKKGRNAPDPKAVSHALREGDISHFIYTSHSHGEEANKYRVVIHSTRYQRKDLVANTSAIFETLAEDGLFIYYGKEMKAWSQHWHLPRRDDPNDEWFYFDKHIGKKWSIKDVQEEQGKEEKTKAERDQESDIESLDQLHENIRTGKEFHESLRTLTYQWLKDGMSKANVKAMARSILQGSQEAGSERWQERFDQIDHLVDDCVITDEEVDISEIKISDHGESAYIPPPKPHGLLGKFIDQTKEFMLYEDDTIAFVTSMFILSSIAGRKFNVDIQNSDGLARPTALNMYFTLAAETGVGKSEIESIVEKCYSEFSGADGAIMDFFYKGRVTGPKALYRVYKDQRSVGVIANEAGIEGQSTLGDSAGLRGAWLNLYGQGAWNKWTGATELSDIDNSIKSVRAVAISRISESTPVELIKYYRQGSSVENGLIPRECVFVIKDINTATNRNIRTSFTSDIVNRVEPLVSKCHSDIGEDTLFKPFIITVDDDSLRNEMFDMMEHYRKIQARGDTVHERAMASRMFVKMLRYVGIITVFNKNSKHSRALLIDREDWEWAKSIVQWEFDRISDVVALTSGSGVMDELVNYVSLKFGQMLNNTIKNKDGKIANPVMRNAGIAPTSSLKKVCKGNKAFVELEGDPKFSTYYKSGFDKVIDYMEKIGYIEKLEKNPHARGSAIKAKEGLLDYLENL